MGQTTRLYVVLYKLSCFITEPVPEVDEVKEEEKKEEEEAEGEKKEEGEEGEGEEGVEKEDTTVSYIFIIQTSQRFELLESV